jgi:hypothetical protein
LGFFIKHLLFLGNNFMRGTHWLYLYKIFCC